MDDQTKKFYEENEGNPEAIAEAYGVDLVDPDETVESAKAVGQFALESLPGVGTAFTVADIEDELKKEEPNYVKIGMLVGTEAIGLIPGLGTAAKNMIRKGADMARQTDEVMDVASNIPKVSRKSAPSYTDAELLEADEIISEWGKGNLTNPELRSKLRDKGFTIETKRISPKMTGDDLEVVGPDGNIVRWKDMPRGKVNREADAAEAARLRNDPDALEQWRKENKLPETQRQKNIPEAEAAAQALIEGSITSKEARKRIQEAFPEPREYTAEEVMNLLPTLTEVQGSLGKKGTRKPILGVEGADLKEGQIVSSRLDIPAYDDYDKWVVSIHDGNQKAGTVVGYGQAIRLKNIRFGSDADTALDIARGIRTNKTTGQDAIDKKTGEPAKQNKATIARIFGEYTSEDPYDLQRRAAEIIASGSDEWVQVGMNPYRKSAFYNKKTGMPVFEADEIIQVGPLVLAKNVKKPTISQMKEMAVRTKEGKLRLFNEGGVAMNEQMEMAFMQEGGVPDNTIGVDPVSGNDIPVGSTAEEVRDDIPAMLSEGEYVVPADVVKYHGLALFEALRNQAKFGLREMAEDGRIGGEPIEEGMEEELTAEDQQLLQEIMSMEDEDVVKAAYGTFIPGNTSTTVPSTQVQMPTSGQTPASTQQVQPATTQQDPSGVYGIVTGSGQPVTSSTPLVNQQPVVQGVVGTTPVTGDSKTTPGTTQTGMVTKKYVAPDCRRIDVLTLNGKIISSTPADFDVFVEATEANLKRFNCIADDEEVKVDDTTTDTTLTGGGDDDDLAPVVKTTGKKDNNLTAKQTLENEGINFDDPLAGAKAALEGGKDSKFFKGMGALGSLLLGPAANLFAGALNVSSQVAKLNAAEMNYEYALMLGDIETANQIKALIDPFKKNMSGAASFVSEFGTSSDRFKNLVGAATEGGAAVEYLFNASKFKNEESVRKAIDTFGTDFINFLGTESTVGTSDGGEDLTGGKQYIYNNVLTDEEKKEVDVRDDNIVMSQRARGDSGGSGSLVTGTATSEADLRAEAAKSSAFAKIMGQTPVSSGSTTPASTSTASSSQSDTSGTTANSVINNNAVNRTGSSVRVGQTTSTGIDAGDGFEWEVKPGTNAKTRVWVGSSSSSSSSSDSSSSSSSSSSDSSCCFIMLEARYGNGTMDEVVRRYRDEYMTDRNRRGYYKTAEVLVPLMRKSKVFKWVVTKTFADPLVSYGKYYYGENKHGVIFTPVKNFWMKLFDVVGGDTEFIRENGEVV